MTMTTQLYLDSAAVNGVHVLTVPHRDLLDLDCMQLIRERLSKLLRRESRPRIVLDLGNLTLLTSDGIALLVALRNAARPLGARIHVANLSPKSRTLFENLRLEGLVRIFPTVDDAVAAFR